MTRITGDEFDTVLFLAVGGRVLQQSTREAFSRSDPRVSAGLWSGTRHTEPVAIMTTPIDRKAPSEQWEYIRRLQADCLQHYQDVREDMERRYPGVVPKCCSSCWQARPATREFFRRNATTPDGLDYYCKECRNTYQRRYREMWRRFMGDLYSSYDPRHGRMIRTIRLIAEERGVPWEGRGEPKECPRCHELKPLTREYYHRALSRSNGYQAYCKACRSKAVRS